MNSSRRRKILIVLYKLEVGGAEHIAITLAKGLDKTKFEPLFCCFKGGMLEQELFSSGIKVYNLNKTNGFDFTLLPRFINIIKKEKIDLIHTHTFSPNLWGRLAGALSGVPVVTTEHTVAAVKRPIQKVIDKVLSGFSAKIVSVSEVVRDSVIKEENILPDKVMTIYNGIDFNIPTYHADLIEKKKRELEINSGSKVIVVIGRLEEPKGHEYLLQAAKVILNEFHNVQFLIVGDGYLKSELIRQTNDLGIRKDVIFSGRRNDISDILTMSDIAVLSSIREGFSIALLEYMACGKPIVATDVGGNSEAIITNKSGIIVPPANHSALAAGILKLLKDESLANKLGMEAKKRYSECFTLKHMVSGIEELYNSTLGN